MQLVASQEGLCCMALIVVHGYDLAVILEGISKASAVLAVFVTVYTVPCHGSGDFKVILVLQICSHSLHILPASSSSTSSDCSHQVGNMKVEEDFDMQVGEEEVNVKTEKGLGSEEEECIGIKDEEGIYCEEEVKEEHIDIKEEEDIDINEDEYVRIKEEVSLQGTVYCVKK